MRETGVRRLRGSERLWGWLAPTGVTLLAMGLRLWHLGRPDNLAFDETYYAKHAWSLIHRGYAQDYVDGANAHIASGDLTGLFVPGNSPTEIVHPEAGKWLIGLGEAAFGLDPVGWRIAAVVIGSLTVLVLARLVRRLTGSTAVGCLAGLLLAFDGAHFVMSRLALLDVFVTFWVVAGVACLVADHDWISARLDRYRLLRPWQVLAGLCLGAACATKWNGVYVVAVFGLAAVVWEVVVRRRFWRAAPEQHRDGRKPRWITSALATGVPAFVTIVGLGLVVYIVSWTGWLMHHEAYEQRFGLGYGDQAPWGDYVQSPTAGPFGGLWDALRSLWHYHVLIFDFHTGDYLASQHHPYQSQARGWLVLDRPVSVDVQLDLPAERCGAATDSSCLREVLILGNPVVWWSGALASVAALVAWIKTRDLRWSVPVLGLVATWVPWLPITDRPIFSFYSVISLPFMIIAVCLLVDMVRRRATTPRARYGVWLGSGLLVVTAVVSFWYFHPILTDGLIPYDAWRDRMWFDRWI